MVLKRSKIRNFCLSAAVTGFIRSQSGNWVPLPLAIVERVCLAFKSCPWTSNHLGDSGIALGDQRRRRRGRGRKVISVHREQLSRAVY